jgi:anti-anti-sigma factor
MSSDPSRYTPFSISVEERADEVVIVVVGELDIASADGLAREVARQRAAGATRVLIDLGEVEFIDSTGLRTLLALRNDAKRHAHALTLVPPASTAERIVAITMTRSLFDWRPDRSRSL